MNRTDLLRRLDLASDSLVAFGSDDQSDDAEAIQIAANTIRRADDLLTRALHVIDGWPALRREISMHLGHGTGGLAPDQHHEDCDYRNSSAAHDFAETTGIDVAENATIYPCNLGCE